MTWPVYFNERLWLVNPDRGFIGVATLWTPKEKIAPEMPENVSLVGQLYTKAGIEYVIRNLWANPKVSCLVILGHDLVESGKAIFEFFKKGTIDGSLPSFGEQIPEKDLRILREKVRLVDLRDETEPKKIAREIKRIRYVGPFSSKPKLFPEAELPGTFPSESSVFRIEAETVGWAWLEIIKTILKFGWKVDRSPFVYGGRERMVLNLCTVITKENIHKPKLFPFFCFGKRQLKNYFKEFFTPTRGEQAYTYGERIFDYEGLDQLAMMAKKLKEFPSNKGALVTLWQPKIDNFPIRQPWRTPCLTLIQGICQEDRLHLTCYFRSNDMFGAWPQNAFALLKLQDVLAQKIDKKAGVLTTISQSAFIDEHDLTKAQKIVDKYDRLFCLWDPRGNLVVQVDGQEIVVKHFSPGGQLLGEFRVDGKKEKAARGMSEKLLRAQVISRIEHALDIGEQLGRAEDAIKLGTKFEQDKGLVMGALTKMETKC